MITDFTQIDEMYTACIEVTGSPPSLLIFDQRALLPLADVAAQLSSAAWEVTADQVRTFAAKGWVKVLPGAVDPTGSDFPGLPLYAIDRLRHYQTLAAAGVGDAELAGHAEQEDWVIENICTTDDLAYVDDDVDQLIAFYEAQVACIAAAFPPGEPGGDASEVRDRLVETERALARLRRINRTAMSDVLQREIGISAHRARWVNEMIRVQMIARHYDQMHAGWSFFVNLQQTVHIENGVDLSTPERPNWASTLRHPLVTEQPARVPIRVPGFVLRGDRVQPTRTLAPDEYRALWEAADLDEYLEVLRLVWSEKECPHCHLRLPKDASNQRVYCSSACANAARQARYRAQNPEAVKRSQNRWRRA